MFNLRTLGYQIKSLTLKTVQQKADLPDLQADQSKVDMDSPAMLHQVTSLGRWSSDQLG